MRVLLSALVAAVAAKAVHAVPVTADNCDPLDPSLCIFPYPNDFWLVNGRTLFGNTTWPEDSSGKPIDPNDGWNGVNGFSPSQPTICYMPNVSLSADPALPRVWDIGQSLSATAHSALIDASTGERVAHWLETDHSSDDWDKTFLEDDRRALMGWPAQRLKGGTRYVFAISHLVNDAGQTIEPSVAFKALRDKLPYAPVEPRRAHFEQDIFPLLTAAGMSRADLSIAWDFTTASDDTWTADMLSMRDQTLALMPQGATFNVMTRNANPRPGVAVELIGLITVPWFLSDTEPVAGTHVVHGATGAPEQQGSNEVDFYAIVPESVASGAVNATAVYYGHGLFGSASELASGYLDTEANNNGWVMIGVNWLGLCDQDLASDAFMVAGDLSLFGFIQARLHQAQANALLAHRSLFTSMTADPALQVDGKPVLTADSPKHYYGNSLGGIMGSVFMSLTTDVTRGVLGVPGGPFSLLLPRSKDFAALFDIIRLRYNRTLERVAMMNLIQEQFTYLEPGGYVNHISADPFPNTPKHTVIIHYGQGDAQVNWLGAEWLGRSIGGTQAYESTLRVRNCSLFGFETIPDSATPAGDSTSLVQGYYFDVPDANIPLVNVPCSSETDTHGKTRETAHAEAQTRLFLSNNTIVNTCGGACHESP